jgi:carboxymethylenebutenolidase
VTDIKTGNVTLQVADGSTMDAYFARPIEGHSHPGMLVFQEAFGVNAHIRDVTDRCAREGLIAIAPQMFHRTAPGFEGKYDDFPSVRPHMEALTVEGMTHDIRAAYDWLLNDRHVRTDSIASIGFCMGGRVSFLACATVPLQGAISFYGGGIAPALLPMVASLHAPMLFFWGGRDKHIASDQIRSIMDECKKQGKAYVNVEFSDADHGFFCDARPSYHPGAAALAWSLIEGYLHLHIKQPEMRTKIR